jgi:molybdopterin synthase sulfur carrier subunit
MSLTLKFIGAIRQISGKNQLTVNYKESSTLKDLIVKLVEDMPGLQSIIGTGSGDSNSSSLILINGSEISVLKGLDTPLKDGDEIVFIPVVHGG